jgi:glyoxalase family protein
MRLHGIHHITAITADARRNLDFYARVLGLRFVKKTVNFDAPDFYHLYYGDELGNPGSVLTFFEFPDAALGRAGAGMIHRIIWRVGDERALEFWGERLAAEGITSSREPVALVFSDPEGLELELLAHDSGDPPLAAAHPEIPREHALLGFSGVRAYGAHPEASHHLLTQALRFTPLIDGAGHRLKGDGREALYHYDLPPTEAPLEGAGTVHHIAWACDDQDQAAWRERVAAEYVYPTEIIDRTYFRSVYFREPSGVLFEIATIGPGFTVDEPAERLGESLRLPPQHEDLRGRLEQSLTPLANPRSEAVEH